MGQFAGKGHSKFVQGTSLALGGLAIEVIVRKHSRIVGLAKNLLRALPLGQRQLNFHTMSTVAEIKTAAAGLVVSNPGILGGTPVFRGTRLPVQTLFDYLADGLSLDYFLESFEGVTREQTKAVLRYGWERIVAELTA